MVFDHAGKYLYIMTSDGFVRPYNLSTGQLETGYNLGGALNGADISPDDSFLLIAQSNTTDSQGMFQRLDLKTGVITNITYTKTSGEGGGWDVAIGANGLALVTTDGLGSTPLRQVDLATNMVTVRTDDPGSTSGGKVWRARIYRSADGSRMYFLESIASNGPLFTYSATTNTFGPSAMTDAVLDSASAAVNRNGSLLGTHLFNRPASLDTAPSLNYVRVFNGLDSSVAFDAVKDTFYGVNSSTNQIIAYDTNTFAELFRLDIGEDVNSDSTQFGPGLLVASQDGHYLALATSSGIRIFAVSNGVPFPTPTPTFGTPRDMVFDHAGQHLYITTTEGLVWPYNLSTSGLETPYDVGGSLNGVDIAPDDSYLLMAQHATGVAEGTFQKLDLMTGAVTNVTYTRAFYEGGGWDVAIGSNGLALVTTDFNGSGSTPLRQIDLATNTITIRTDAPGSAFGEVGQETDIYRSADGTRMYFLEGNSSGGPIFTYSATTNTFGPSTRTNSFSFSASAAVNRNGSLLGTRLYNSPAYLATAPDFSFVHSFNGLDSGVAFDAVKDIFYGVNSSTDQIIAYDTNSFAELFRSISQEMGVLIGDLNGDGVVNVGDTALVRSNAGVTLDNTNFRYDVSVDGFVNIGDTAIVKSKSGDFLAGAPASALKSLPLREHIPPPQSLSR